MEAKKLKRAIPAAAATFLASAAVANAEKPNIPDTPERPATPVAPKIDTKPNPVDGTYQPGEPGYNGPEQERPKAGPINPKVVEGADAVPFVSEAILPELNKPYEPITPGKPEPMVDKTVYPGKSRGVGGDGPEPIRPEAGPITDRDAIPLVASGFPPVETGVDHGITGPAVPAKGAETPAGQITPENQPK